MKVQAIKIDIFPQQPNPNPIRDALQALPGSGSVQVTVTTEDGVSGVGEVGFGRIAGARPLDGGRRL